MQRDESAALGILYQAMHQTLADECNSAIIAEIMRKLQQEAFMCASVGIHMAGQWLQYLRLVRMIGNRLEKCVGVE